VDACPTLLSRLYRLTTCESSCAVREASARRNDTRRSPVPLAKNSAQKTSSPHSETAHVMVRTPPGVWAVPNMNTEMRGGWSESECIRCQAPRPQPLWSDLTPLVLRAAHSALGSGQDLGRIWAGSGHNWASRSLLLRLRHPLRRRRRPPLRRRRKQP